MGEGKGGEEQVRVGHAPHFAVVPSVTIDPLKPLIIGAIDLSCAPLGGSPPINFSHDFLSPPDRVGDGAHRCRNPLSALILSKLPRWKEGFCSQKSPLYTITVAVELALLSVRVATLSKRGKDFAKVLMMGAMSLYICSISHPCSGSIRLTVQCWSRLEILFECV